MNRTRSMAAAASAALCFALAAAPASAQIPVQYEQAISANPFGLLLELFNGEYERVVTESGTAGIGGSFFTRDDLSYRNVDAFYRFYPSGLPLEGWSFGGKVGITSVPEEDYVDFEGRTQTNGGTFFGLGFDVNRSWLLGKNNNFYVGAGFGLKRLYGVPENNSMIEYIPTFRIVNVGFAF